MKIFTAALATGALTLAAATAAPAQKPAKPPGGEAVTIAVGANPVTFSTPLAITGDVKGAKAGVVVTLQARPARSAVFATVATVSTDDKGRYSFSQRPRANTTYKTLAGTQPPSQSAELLARVSPLVGFRVSDTTPSRGERVSFSGTVRPTHDGRSVSIQRKRADGSFATVTRTRLRDAGSVYSRYSRRMTIRRTGTYRVRILGHDDHAQGVSRERTLTVR